MGKYDSNPIIEGRYDAYGRKTYWNEGYTGKGVKIALIDDMSEEHAYMMQSVRPYLAPGCELTMLDMKGSAQGIRDMLYRAIQIGANIVSLSRSADNDTKDLHDAVIACRNAGITVFCSAGNTGENFVDTVDIKRYPAAYPETVSVLCIDNTYAPSKMSSHGSTGVITGFGQNVLVKNKAGEEVLVSGTSPVTAACAFSSALYFEKSKKLTGRFPTPSEMDTFVRENAVDLGAIGRDNMTGFGFYTLDKSEYERIRMMILDSDKNGLTDRVDRIHALMNTGMSYEAAEAQISKEYFVVSYEVIEGILVPVYGGRKPY